MAAKSAPRPLRWDFAPVKGAGGALLWRWYVYTAQGEAVMRSGNDFRSFTDCVADARLYGYEGPQPPGP